MPQRQRQTAHDLVEPQAAESPLVIEQKAGPVEVEDHPGVPPDRHPRGTGLTCPDARSGLRRRPAATTGTSAPQDLGQGLATQLVLEVRTARAIGGALPGGRTWTSRDHPIGGPVLKAATNDFDLG